jgi:hypothetical protein
LAQAEGRAVAKLSFRRALRAIGLRRVEADQPIRLPVNTNRVAVHDLDRARIEWAGERGKGQEDERNNDSQHANTIQK